MSLPIWQGHPPGCNSAYIHILCSAGHLSHLVPGGQGESGSDRKSQPEGHCRRVHGGSFSLLAANSNNVPHSLSLEASANIPSQIVTHSSYAHTHVKLRRINTNLSTKSTIPGVIVEALQAFQLSFSLYVLLTFK